MSLAPALIQYVDLHYTTFCLRHKHTTILVTMYRDSTPVLPAKVLSRDFPITNYHPNCHSNYHAKHRTINTRISRISPVTCSPHADSPTRQLPGSNAGSLSVAVLLFRGLVPIEFQLDLLVEPYMRLSPARQLLMMCLQPTMNAVVALARPASLQLLRLYMIPASP